MNLTRTWFARRPAQARFEKMQRVCIFQMFPGLGRARFDAPLQAAGNAILACLWHWLEERGSRTLNTLPFRGYTAEVRGDGLHYGGARGCEFVLDLMVKPGASTGRALDPVRQAGLLQRALTVLKYANSVTSTHRLPSTPLMPEVLTVSAERPEFAVTPMLRSVAASRLNVAEDKLDDAVAWGQYLPKLFNELVREPRSEKNPTGSYLVPSVFANKHTGIFMEDFDDLLGVDTFNPTRMLLNPSERIMRDMNVTVQQLEADGPGNRYEEYLRNFRGFLGDELQAVFDEEAIGCATINHDLPLRTSEGKTVSDLIGEARFLQAVRSSMTDDYQSLAIDAELQVAVANPTSPIRLMGVCKPQAVYLQQAAADVQAVNYWTPQVLGTATTADLWVDRLRQKVRNGRGETAVQSA